MAKESIETTVLATLEAARAEVISMTRKNHLKIRWRYRGETRLTVLAQTTSDHRAVKNAVALVKRQMREIDHG